MARANSRFVCGTCGEVYLRWEGQCRACGAWNSLVETVVHEQPRTARAAATSAPAAATALTEIATEVVPRWPTGIGELDRVLGGGFVPGSVVLLGGEPGIGKSTLLLQAASGLAGTPAEDVHVLYASGEESAQQIHLRAARLGFTKLPVGSRIRVAAEADVGRIVELARSAGPRLLLVDSVQTISVDELDGPAGSVGQVREATLRLMELAKGEGIGVVLFGHVTKDGTLAGPKALEHLVDVVLALEGDRYGALRLLRASKNQRAASERRRDRLDAISFQLHEIEGLDPRIGEDDELRQRRALLRHAARLGELSAVVLAALSDDDGAAVGDLARAERGLDAIAECGLSLAGAAERLAEARVHAEEVARELRSLLVGVEEDPVELETVETRLHRLETLMLKYGSSLDQVLVQRNLLSEGRCLSFFAEFLGLEQRRRACECRCSPLLRKRQLEQ